MKMAPNISSITDIIDDFDDKISDLDHDIMGEVVGVAGAMDDVRKALEEIDQCLNQREFREAAQLGYRDISSAFIFLQRALGGLQMVVHQKEELTCNVAAKAKLAYEDVEPVVTARFESHKPRVKMSEQDKKAVLQRFKDKFGLLEK